MVDKNKTAIVWFRQDLRLDDNPALIAALKAGYKIIPLFILDDVHAGQWARGGASRWWLHESLQALNSSLDNALIFRKGDALTLIPELMASCEAEAIFWNRCYEPWRIKRDTDLKALLQDGGIQTHSFNASLLWEPWEIKKADGTPYKVFTPYYRKGCLGAGAIAAPLACETPLRFADQKVERGSVDDLELLPAIKWYNEMAEIWEPGEQGAQKRKDAFLEDGLKGYKEKRNRPDQNHVSRLSPHLHYGEISVRRLWHDASASGHAQNAETDLDCFHSELGWREFSTYLLYHFNDLPWENLNPRFNNFEWLENESDALERWRRGRTGIPIVDAGMRQLWREGWMHNRVRMIVASLLVKNMGIHWRKGAVWFWDTLVDADLASNSASWQWVAGSGADAAPYFRIFNPVTQGVKFDPEGLYVRRYVPELERVDNKYIHEPWKAPLPPKDYPSPIVDLKTSRKAALEAYAQTKEGA